MLPFIIITSIQDTKGSPEDQLAKMNATEKAFVENILNNIDSTYTLDQLITLFGEPKENLFGQKVEWAVEMEKGKTSRVIVNFFEGKPNTVRFDGGPGSYYFVRDID